MKKCSGCIFGKKSEEKDGSKMARKGGNDSAYKALTDKDASQSFLRTLTGHSNSLTLNKEQSMDASIPSYNFLLVSC